MSTGLSPKQAPNLRAGTGQPCRREAAIWISVCELVGEIKCFPWKPGRKENKSQLPQDGAAPMCTSIGSGLPEREGVVANEGLALSH